MDIYVIGKRDEQDLTTDSNGVAVTPERNVVSSRRRPGVFSQEGFLSAKAKNHIGFVTEINSTLMETAIFAYLGIFLLNRRYHWNVILPLIAIIACILSRAITVVFSSTLSNIIARVGSAWTRKVRNACVGTPGSGSTSNVNTGKENGVVIDGRMQIVLIFSGLRGAMSFALVETVPMYDASTGEGSRYKPELKAMTSACISFTVFVLGGYTYYLLEKLGLSPTGKDEESLEMVSLINVGSNQEPWGGKQSPCASGPQRRKRNIKYSDDIDGSFFINR